MYIIVLNVMRGKSITEVHFIFDYRAQKDILIDSMYVILPNILNMPFSLRMAVIIK
jgi:hypothetical protein